MYDERVSKLRIALQKQNLDGLLVTQPANMRYLTGFTGGEAWVAVTADSVSLATESRYFEQVAREAPQVELVKLQGNYRESLLNFLSGIPGERIGFESDHLTVRLFQEVLQKAKGKTWIPTVDLVRRLRAIKEPDEIKAISKAIRVAEESFEEAVALVRPGKTTEKELAWWLEKGMRERGAEKLAFDTIVASGPNGAMAHAVPGDTVITPGVPVVIDMGAQVDGYCSDFTRTVSWGIPRDPERFWEVYLTVLQAQENAIANLVPGMNGKEGDALAREVIEKAGYGGNFGHSLGHGVGLEVHELPRLSAWAEDSILQTGMVVTVEPGIYLKGWGGVRIEDMVIISDEGAEVLTSITKENPVL